MNKLDVSTVKALTFDVFDTVVDWRSTVIREMEPKVSHTNICIVLYAIFILSNRKNRGPTYV